MAKTTLTIDVHYDARRTDPEGLASAMDRLLETALSTPRIMEEYGDPRMGEFLVAPSASTDGQHYALRIDGGLLRQQRLLLLTLADSASKCAIGIPTDQTKELLEGVVVLLDEIADQAHDRYGINCLLDADEQQSRTTRPELPGT